MNEIDPEVVLLRRFHAVEVEAVKAGTKTPEQALTYLQETANFLSKMSPKSKRDAAKRVLEANGP